MASRIVCMLPHKVHSAHVILAAIHPLELITPIEPGKNKGKAREHPLPVGSVFSRREETNTAELGQTASIPSLKRLHEGEDDASFTEV